MSTTDLLDAAAADPAGSVDLRRRQGRAVGHLPAVVAGRAAAGKAEPISSGRRAHERRAGRAAAAGATAPSARAWR